MKPRAAAPRTKEVKVRETAPSDQTLVVQALAGEKKAFATLLERHRQAVFHITFQIVHNQEEARDLVQETFMKTFAGLATYRSQYRFTTWLYKIAANCAIDALRKKKIDALSLDQPLETDEGTVAFEVADPAADPEAELVAEERRLSIGAAIDALPKKYREVLVFRHREEKSYEEISAILKIPVGTVKARIFRARELLKKKLKHYRP